MLSKLLFTTLKKQLFFKHLKLIVIFQYIFIIRFAYKCVNLSINTLISDGAKDDRELESASNMPDRLKQSSI